jgi:integrative and conjugative element protein (TIGR02256 family)
MRRTAQPLVLVSTLGTVVFQPEVLRTFARFQQTTKTKHEAGGQLFASFELSQVNVLLATGPTSKAERGRYFFRPNRKEEQLEIAAAFIKDLHFVGDWHTHPEPEPTPSAADIAKAKGIFEKSAHELRGLLLVVIGTAEPPHGIWAGWVTRTGISPMRIDEGR